MNQYLGRQKVKRATGATSTSTAPTVFKRSGLKYHDAYGFEFSSVAFDNQLTIPIKASASCGLRSHEAPKRFCSCGFHGYRDLEKAVEHEQGNRRSVILTAVASGKIFEYSSGYRYEKQRVKEILLDKCFDCDNYADSFSTHYGSTITACCYQHASPRSRLSLSMMEENHNSISPHKIRIKSIHSFVEPWEPVMVKAILRKAENGVLRLKSLLFSLGVPGFFALVVWLATIR